VIFFEEFLIDAESRPLLAGAGGVTLVTKAVVANFLTGGLLAAAAEGLAVTFRRALFFCCTLCASSSSDCSLDDTSIPRFACTGENWQL
jgi:hypothetical protein